MRHLLNVVIAFLSIGAFVLALYLAYQDKPAAAGVCIIAAILPILFSQLPFVEYLKIPGLEARLRERVNEADAIITKLRRIASVSAEQLFTQTALAGRWGGEALSSKQERAVQLTTMLRGLDVPPAEITAAKTMFLRAIAHDLAHIFFSVIRALLSVKKVALARERETLFGNNPVDMRDPKGARWNELVAEERRIDTQVKWPNNVFGSSDVEDLRAFCVTFIDGTDVLTSDERSTLVTIADEVNSLFSACRELGNYTAETICYLETYEPTANYVNNHNLRFSEAFPEISKTSA